MANTGRDGYDTGIGTKERSVVAATKVWGIVLAVVVLLGVIMITVFLMRSGTGGSGGGAGSGNTSTRPAGP